VMASGGFALAYTAAQGGLAVAHQFAIGGAAFAEHANDLAARSFFAKYSWLDVSRPEVQRSAGILCWLPFLLFFPVIRKSLWKRR
jgi:hypothetical protein